MGIWKRLPGGGNPADTMDRGLPHQGGPKRDRRPSIPIAPRASERSLVPGKRSRRGDAIETDRKVFAMVIINRLALAGICAAAALPAFAQIQFSNDASVTAGNGWDFIQWTEANQTVMSQGFTKTSSGISPATATFTDNSGSQFGDMTVLDQQPPGSFNPGWFAQLGPKVLYSLAGPLQFTFDRGLFGVAFKVEPEWTQAHTTTVELLDNSLNVIGSPYTFNSLTGDPDFFGVDWLTPDIYGVRIDVNVSGAPGNGFALGDIGVRLTAPPPVPEPGTWAAMGVLGASVAGMVLRRRRRP